MSFIAAIALAYEPAKRLARTQISLEAGPRRRAPDVRAPRHASRPSNTNPNGPELEVDARARSSSTMSISPTARARPVLFQGFDFIAAGGKTTALVGPSGGGKST